MNNLDDIRFRKATYKDLNKLTELRILQQIDDWGSEYSDMNNDFYDRTLKSLGELLRVDDAQQSNCTIFVAEKDSKIVATCGIHEVNMLPQCNDNGKYGYIFNVFTIKELRRMGIQTKLLKNVIDYAKERDIAEISLESDNEIAIKMYEKLGFSRNQMLMTKEIGG